MLLRDAQGQLLSRATRTFDGKGRVSEERQTTENFAVFDEQTFYTYDAQDRLIQMRSKTLFHSSEDTTRYNDHGDVSESHSVNRGPDLPPEGGFYDEENGVVKMDGEVLPIKILHEFQVSYIYHYDDYGNWTERTTSTSTGQKENLIESTQYRKLTYY